MLGKMSVIVWSYRCSAWPETARAVAVGGWRDMTSSLQRGRSLGLASDRTIDHPSKSCGTFDYSPSSLSPFKGHPAAARRFRYRRIIGAYHSQSLSPNTAVIHPTLT